MNKINSLDLEKKKLIIERKEKSNCELEPSFFPPVNGCHPVENDRATLTSVSIINGIDRGLDMKVSQGSNEGCRKTEPQRKLPEKPSRVGRLVILDHRIFYFLQLFASRSMTMLILGEIFGKICNK